MLWKRCIKPEAICGRRYATTHPEFVDGYCRCGARLEEFVESEIASLNVYAGGEKQKTLELLYDETLVGRRSHASHPDLDLSPYDAEKETSRQHVLIYREQGLYHVRVLSARRSVHLNNDRLAPDQEHTLRNGDVIVLSGKIALQLVF